MFQSKLIQFTLLAAIGSVSSACMMSPVHGDIINDRNDQVTFTFYATSPSTEITVECAPSYFGSFIDAFSFTSSSNAFPVNGDDVYSAGGRRVLPSGCWDYVHGRWMTRIRPKQDGYSMRVYNEEGIDCLGTKLGEGDGALSAGNECGMKYSNSNNFSEIIYMYADN